MAENPVAPSVRRHADGLTATATLVGEPEILSRSDLVERLLLLVDEGVRYIVIDATQLGMVDSTGLGALVRLHQATTERGGWLRVVAPGKAVRRPLELTGLDQVIDVRDTTE